MAWAGLPTADYLGRLRGIARAAARVKLVVVPDFCTCGAQLPPDARFCHKCGKPQFDYPTPETEPAQISVVPPPLPGAKPAPAEISFKNRTAVRISFIVAVLAIVFFLLPLPTPPFFQFLRLIVGFFLAGFVAALWYERRTGERLSMRSGARIGWITGVFSFAMFVAMATAAVIAISSQGGLANFYKKTMPTQDPNMEQVIKALGDPAGAVLFMVFTLVFLFVVLTTLPMLGGAVRAKVSEKRV
jgi:hypothetical protein